MKAHQFLPPRCVCCRSSSSSSSTHTPIPIPLTQIQWPIFENMADRYKTGERTNERHIKDKKIENWKYLLCDRIYEF